MWKPVKDYENYFKINELGQIFSIRTNRILKPSKLKTGYLALCSKIGGRSGKNICIRIHRMVAEAFLPKIEGKNEVNHIDGDKENNCIENLEWCNHSENLKHSWKTGLHKPIKSELHGSAKLTQNDVDYIRLNYVKGCGIYGCRAMANRFNVNHSQISRIVNNKQFLNN